MTKLFNALIACLVPVTVWIVWKKKSSARTFPLVIGMLSYIFISMFRGLARIFVLNDSVQAHPWLFFLLSAVVSGVFEEVGRYIVFRYVAPKYDYWKDCISYGIGHGATEIFLTHSFFNDNLSDSLFVCYDFAAAILFSSAMSVLVFAAVHHAGNRKLLYAATVIHTAFDVSIALEFYGIASFGMVVLIDQFLIVVSCFLAYKVYKYHS